MNKETDIVGLVQSTIRKLGPVQKRIILNLPPDGSWAKVESDAAAKRLWQRFILDHKHRPADCTNGHQWRLRGQFAIQLRQALKGDSHE